MNIYEKLIEVRKEVPYLKKENQGQQYNYVSSSQVLMNCISKMNELGLLLVPSVTNHKVSETVVDYYDKEGRVNKHTTTYFTELDMTMTWINSEDPEEKIVCNWYGQGVDIAGEKGVGKALTYAEKYFLLKFFNISTDKDDPDVGRKPRNTPTETPSQQKQQQGISQTILNMAQKAGIDQQELGRIINTKFKRPWEQLTSEEKSSVTKYLSDQARQQQAVG